MRVNYFMPMSQENTHRSLGLGLTYAVAKLTLTYSTS